jgi:hypothetical protein
MANPPTGPYFPSDYSIHPMGIKRKMAHLPSTVIFSLSRRVMDLIDDLMITNPMLEFPARFVIPGILSFPGNTVHPSHPSPVLTNKI